MNDEEIKKELVRETLSKQQWHEAYIKEKEKNAEIKSKDYKGLMEDFEHGLYISKFEVDEDYIRIERFIELEKELEAEKEKNKLLEDFFKQRLKKYQDADDGVYKQNYLSRGELELVDRYKECSEIYKMLFGKEEWTLELNYVSKDKIKAKIEKIRKLKNDTKNNGFFIITQGLEREIAVLQELLEEGDD